MNVTEGGGEGARAQEIGAAALDLLIELECFRLHVVLVPSSDPDWVERGWMVRGADEENCEWYQEFCDRYQKHRLNKGPRGKSKPRMRRNYSDTAIKREHTVRALERIIAGKREGIYVERIWPFIVERMKEIRARERRERRHERASKSMSQPEK